MTPEEMAALNTFVERLYDVLEEKPEFAAAVDGLNAAGFDLSYIDLLAGIRPKVTAPVKIETGKRRRLVDLLRKIRAVDEPKLRAQRDADLAFLKSLRIDPDLDVTEGRR